MAELQEVEIIDIPIAEMSSDAEAIIPLDSSLVESLTAGDDNPQFPIIRVESGVSKNKLEWTPEQLVDIAEQINSKQPYGYLGHISPGEERYAFPAPQTRWLKAVTKLEEGKTALYVKGYNLPDEPIRKYVRTKAVDAVSWHGKAAVQHMKGGVQRVVKFALESIDWSRKGKSAMSAQLVTIAAEMEGKEEDVDITKMTPTELKEANPNLYTLIVNESQAEATEKIEELQEKEKVADDSTALFAKIREVLGIDETMDVLEAVTKIVKKIDDIGKKNVRERVFELLKSKIKDEDTRNTVLRLLPVNEMSEDLDDDGLKKRVDECFDTDTEIKAIVNRLGNGGSPLKQRQVDEMDGGDGHYESGKSTGNVKVTRTKL